MLHVGFDLSRKRLDFHVLASDGTRIAAGAAPPDADGLASLSRRLNRHGQPLVGAIESMTGARFVHDELERHGWQVEIADAQKAKGSLPLPARPTGSTPGSWQSSPRQRAGDLAARPRGAGRARARPLSPSPRAPALAPEAANTPDADDAWAPPRGVDLFGVQGRELLARLELPEPWHSTVAR